MIERALLESFEAQLDRLKIVVEASAQRVIVDPPDDLFYENQNVFIKSYLVSACSILEAFIQELALSCSKIMHERITSLNLPFNFVNWLAEHDKAKLDFKKFEGRKKDKDIFEMISPNYYKTKLAFERLGLDVNSDDVMSHRDFISSIVDKRNSIVHHNDAASDLSFSDVVATINTFKTYAACLFDAIRNNSHLAAPA